MYMYSTCVLISMHGGHYLENMPIQQYCMLSHHCSHRVHHLPAEPAVKATRAAGGSTERGEGSEDHERVGL